MFNLFRRSTPTPVPQPARLDEIIARLKVINKMRKRIGELIRNQQVANDGVYPAALNQLNVERCLLVVEAEVTYGVNPLEST